MIVPQYWAEGRVAEPRKHRGGRVVIRRFGWSDESQEAAQAHADQRAREAFDRVKAGEDLRRFEQKTKYGGLDGLPIREEIVARHGADVITRNSYGARCLNTPDVLFADVDVPTEGFFAWMRAHLRPVLRLFAPERAEDPWHAAERRIRAYAAAHPTHRFRLYRTPAGFRILALHRTFASDAPEVFAMFEALGVDPIYTRMCRLQRCFRARLTPKPWRIGLRSHLKPARSTWPVKPEHRQGREKWIAEYERASRGHAACRFIEEIGTGHVDDRAATVQRLHDDACQATRDLPIA